MTTDFCELWWHFPYFSVFQNVLVFWYFPDHVFSFKIAYPQISAALHYSHKNVLICCIATYILINNIFVFHLSSSFDSDSFYFTIANGISSPIYSKNFPKKGFLNLGCSDYLLWHLLLAQTKCPLFDAFVFAP